MFNIMFKIIWSSSQSPPPTEVIGGQQKSATVAASTKMLLLTTLVLLMLDRTSAQNITLNLTRFDPPEQLDVGVSRHAKKELLMIPPC